MREGNDYESSIAISLATYTSSEGRMPIGDDAEPTNNSCGNQTAFNAGFAGDDGTVRDPTIVREDDECIGSSGHNGTRSADAQSCSHDRFHPVGILVLA